MNYDSEKEAFERFSKVFPSNPALLLDTYDTVEGARTAASLKVAPSFVRLDSGDRYELSVKVRRILDEAGLKKTKIFVSGDLNEYILDDLTARAAPIDSFGVGTELVTSRDDPALQGIYKLVATTRKGETTYRVKTSEGKRTLPGAKQIYRAYSADGGILNDILALESENPPRGTKPLMTQVLKQGRLRQSLPNIEEIRGRAAKQVASLPVTFKALEGSEPAPVSLSRNLEELSESLWSKSGHT